MTTRLTRQVLAVRAPRPSDGDASPPGGGAAPPPASPSTPARDHVSVDFSTPGFEPPDDEPG